MEEEGEKAHDDHNACGLRSGLVVHGRASSPDDVRDQHADATPVEERAPAQSINQERRGQGCSEVEDLKQAVDEGLVEGICDADSVQHQGQVIADNTDTVLLSERAQADEYPGAQSDHLPSCQGYSDQVRTSDLTFHKKQ